jgi:NADH-quinone oxidoreductase subunit A
VDVLLSISLFLVVGASFVFANLSVGSLLRPRAPHPEKASIYECGEPTIGSSWVQFDLRFYIIALVYLVFDVEVALFYPWAVAYGDAEALGKSLSMSAFQFRSAALVDMLFFFGILVVGFAYLWRFGYLDWVRSSATTTLKIDRLVSAEHPLHFSQEARVDSAA